MSQPLPPPAPVEVSTEEHVERLCGGMVTGFVLIVSYLDANGDQLYYGDTMEGQPAWVTLGLTEMVAAIERQRIADNHFDDDDGEDEL